MTRTVQEHPARPSRATPARDSPSPRDAVAAAQVVGIPWFRPEDYEMIRKLAPGDERLPPGYDQWIEQAERQLRELGEKGLRPVRAVIRLQPFVNWCHQLRIAPDARARQAFANEEAYCWYLEHG